MNFARLSVLLIFLAAVFSASMAAGEDQSKETVIPQITDGKTVSLHYTLTVEDKVVDSSKGRDPLKFKVGSRQLIPGFEKAVQGMKVGDKKTFQISPEEGYGPVNPDAFREVPRDKLPPDVKLEPGMQLITTDVKGNNRPVTIKELTEKGAIINFNHPLAGKTLHFDVEIMEIL